MCCQMNSQPDDTTLISQEPNRSEGDTALESYGNMHLSNNRRFAFPWKLHQLLQDVQAEGDESIISWLPSGRSFKVHNRENFVTKILPKSFRQTSFKSFQRQLYIYGFERISSGDEKGAHCHPMFVKGKRELTFDIQRIPQTSNSTNAITAASSAHSRLQTRDAQHIGRPMAGNALVAPTIFNASSAARAPHMPFQRFNEVSARVEGQHSTTASVVGQQRDASFPPERAPAHPFTSMALPSNPLSYGAKLPSLKQGESMVPLPHERHGSEVKQLAKLKTSGLQNLQIYAGMLKAAQLPSLNPPIFGVGATEQNPASLAPLGSSIDQHRGINAPPVTSSGMYIPSGQLLPPRVQFQGVSTSQEQARQMNEIMQYRQKEAEGESSDWFSTLERHFPPPG